ncbi:MAG: transcription antitermination factor NusB, partial [Hyphomicrobiaceae bacterium]
MPAAPRRGLPAGYAARHLAVDLLHAVLVEGHDLDWALARAFAGSRTSELAPRDRALARAIAATVLRRHGQLAAPIGACLTRPLPEDHGKTTLILLAAAAQLLFLGTPAHAAVAIAVEQCRRDRSARRFDKLVNAVLRRLADSGPASIAAQDAVTLNIPAWLLARWIETYGEEQARSIALTSLQEAALDITAKNDPQEWARQFGGRLLPTGSIRLQSHGRIEDLPGYAAGAWWVQD